MSAVHSPLQAQVVQWQVEPGAAVQSGDLLVILEAMKIGFAYYVARFSTYTMIYGAFAALPVFLIWIYLCWLGILLGALTAANLPLFRLGRLNPEVRPGAALIDALSVLQLLSQARGQQPPGCSSAGGSKLYPGCSGVGSGDPAS